VGIILNEGDSDGRIEGAWDDGIALGLGLG